MVPMNASGRPTPPLIVLYFSMTDWCNRIESRQIAKKKLLLGPVPSSPADTCGDILSPLRQLDWAEGAEEAEMEMGPRK